MTTRAAVTPVVRHGADRARADQDLVAVEAPLAIVLRHPQLASPHRLGIVMRTPGDDRELVAGLLLAEELIAVGSDIGSMATAMRDDIQYIDVSLSDGASIDALSHRSLTITSGCGLCGRVEMLRARRRRARTTAPVVFDAETIANAPTRLAEQQTVFAETGGLHAAGLMDASGAIVLIREDVGRHNAVDKLVGALLFADRLPAADHVLVVSGRVAFEIVQKAAAAGVDAIVSVGAPSSLAIDAARAAHLTLAGFARDGRFNVYTGADRIR